MKKLALPGHGTSLKDKKLLLENEDLRDRLEEAEEFRRAISSGQVDAVVVSGPDGDQLFVLNGAEQPYRMFLETMNEGAVTLTAAGTISYCNQRFAAMLGLALEQVIGVSLEEFASPAYRQALRALLERGLSGSAKDEVLFAAGESKPVWAALSVCPVSLAESRGISMVATDITAQKRTESILRQTQRELDLKNRLANIFLTVPDQEMFAEVLSVLLRATESQQGFFGYIDNDGNLVCPAMTRAWDHSRPPGMPGRFPRRTWSEVWYKSLLQKKRPVYFNKSASVGAEHVPAQRVLAVPLVHKDEVIGVFEMANRDTAYDELDRTFVESVAAYLAPVLKARLERDSHETALSSALTAKGVLLQEVHHRVKNNLQIIASLLSLQARTLPEAAQLALESSQRRVRSMALVHELLYSHEEVSELDFAEYLKCLAADLSNAYLAESNGVALRYEVDPVLLGANQAIPCGLIINELVTNSLKYAFPGNRGGEIVISLHSGGGCVAVRVADNGIGLPSDFDWRQSKSLGLRIVNILTSQLNGTLLHPPGQGADFTLTFRKQAPVLESGT